MRRSSRLARWILAAALAVTVLVHVPGAEAIPNTWSAAADMATARGYHTATRLLNGKVLVAGGDNGGPGASAELYDPVANVWSPAGSLTVGRWAHTATLLLSGKVLVVGGQNTASAELYDPSADTWSSAGNMAESRWYHTATLLQDGRVVVAGGCGGTCSSRA